MHIRVMLDSKQESDRITAFFDQLSHYGHTIEAMFTKEDLLDSQQPPDLGNISLQRHHLSFVDRVVYIEGGSEKELYVRPVNKHGIRRKTHE